MNLNERKKLINEYYGGDYTMYFFDTVKEYSKVLSKDTMSNSIAFQELVKKLIDDLEELLKDE